MYLDLFSSAPIVSYIGLTYLFRMLYTLRYGLVMMTKKSAQKPAAKASNVFGSDSSDEDEEGSVKKVNASLKKPGWVTKEVHYDVETLHVSCCSLLNLKCCRQIGGSEQSPHTDYFSGYFKPCLDLKLRYNVYTCSHLFWPVQ